MYKFFCGFMFQILLGVDLGVKLLDCVLTIFNILRNLLRGHAFYTLNINVYGFHSSIFLPIIMFFYYSHLSESCIILICICLISNDIEHCIPISNDFCYCFMWLFFKSDKSIKIHLYSLVYFPLCCLLGYSSLISEGLSYCLYLFISA